MISTAGRYRTACAANRCISTAPSAKFAATITLDSWPSSDRSFSTSCRSSWVIPVVPTTACTACEMHQRMSSIATSGCVKSIATSALASSSRSSSSETGTSISG